MSSDDLMIVLIIMGVGLSGVYFRAGYLEWRRHQAAERKSELNLREVFANRSSRDENAVPGSRRAQAEESVERVSDSHR